MLWKKETGIILALDLPDQKSAFSIVEQVVDHVDLIKFNYPLVLKEGIQILKLTAERFNRPVFADFKIADVPVTNNRIIRLCREYGASAAMIHGFVGVDALLRAKRAAGDMKLFIATQLTNPGGADFFEPHWEKFAELARELGFAGVQAPGNRPEIVRRVRQIVGPELSIVSCGIGAQGGDYGAAIAAGANFEIIGRAIYQADDPTAKIRQIKQTINSSSGTI